MFISLHALLNASGNPKMNGTFLGRLFVRPLPQQDLLPMMWLLGSSPGQQQPHFSPAAALCRGSTAGLKPALKNLHLCVYQELSGEMSLIRAVGNLSSRDEDLCARAALAGQEEQSPLPGLCPISVPSPAFKGLMVLSL